MAEPSASNFPAALATFGLMGGTPVNQKSFVVSGAHSDSVQTITTTALISGITAPCYLVVGSTGEVLYAQGISGAQFTSVVRGADGTTAAPIASGAVLYHILPANILKQYVREIIGIETELGVNPKSIDDTVVPGASPSSVANYLDMLANILKTFRGAANWYSSNVSLFNDSEGDPANLGTAADGTSTYTARRDHVHALSSIFSDAAGDPQDPKGAAADGTGLYASRWDHAHKHLVYAVIPVTGVGVALVVGDGKAYLPIPAFLNGWNLVSVHAWVDTVSTSGLVTVMIRNKTDAQDMLSTALTIDANENGSDTAATPAVINTSYDDVATYDILEVDVDGAGTGAKGLIVTAGFGRP